MNSVFEHIEQTRYLLYQLFESGFISQRSIESGLNGCERSANELGLPHGAQLLHTLAWELAALRAGQGTAGCAALCYSNLISYYDMVSTMLIIENIPAKAEQ